LQTYKQEFSRILILKSTSNIVGQNSKTTKQKVETVFKFKKDEFPVYGLIKKTYLRVILNFLIFAKAKQKSVLTFIFANGLF